MIYFVINRNHELQGFTCIHIMAVQDLRILSGCKHFSLSSFAPSYPHGTPKKRKELFIVRHNVKVHT